MAKYGEGDKRWIVSDRPDGTNVHNWHWAETDCLEWSKSHLKSSLSNLPILTGEEEQQQPEQPILIISTKSVEKVSGEAYVNIRKGKIIPGYELSVSLSWEGEAKDRAGNSVFKSDGVVEIPYISDENAGEDPELRVSIKDESPIGRKLKEAFLEKGKGLILDRIRAYVECMAQGGPCRDEIEAKKTAAAAPKAPAGTEKKAVVAAVGEARKEVAKKEKVKERKGFKMIKLTEKFSCRAVDMYEILMDENRWKGFTQSNAKISKDVGGEFSIFDGSVMGTNVDLQPGKLIVQKWRFGSWPDGVFSTVYLSFLLTSLLVYVVFGCVLVYAD